MPGNGRERRRYFGVSNTRHFYFYAQESTVETIDTHGFLQQDVVLARASPTLLCCFSQLSVSNLVGQCVRHGSETTPSQPLPVCGLCSICLERSLKLWKLEKLRRNINVLFASLVDALLGARQSSREGDKPSADSASAL